jgi:hypothetical protein
MIGGVSYYYFEITLGFYNILLSNLQFQIVSQN